VNYLEFLGLALYAAIYPTLIAAVAILLTQPRPFNLLSAYLGGGLVISITLGLVGVFALGGAVSSSSSTLSWELDLTLGGLALLLAVALATGLDQRARERRERRKARRSGTTGNLVEASPPKEESEDREPWSQRILSKGSVPIVFAAGLVVNVPGMAYLAAIKDIAAAHKSTLASVLLILLFNVIMFAAAEIPWLGLLRSPERTHELVDRADHWFSENSRRVAMYLAGTLGLLLIARGIAHAL
jgi:Sap, sulfolipid-1-addressing protein